MQRARVFPVLWIAASALLGMLRFHSLLPGASYDDAHYIILAESLSSGQGYRLINFPQPQLERAFPPGWPILLAPFTFLFPGNYTVLKLVSMGLWLVSIGLIYKIFSRRMDSPYLEMVSGLVALNPLLVGTSVTVMSESAYLFFSLLALNTFDAWREKQDKKKDWLLVPVILLALYVQWIRTIGIALILGWMLYLLLVRRWREAGLSAGFFTGSVLLQMWINLQNGGSLVSAGYEAQVFRGSVLEKIGQMGSNALGYLNQTAAGTILPVFGSGMTALFEEHGWGAVPALMNAVLLILIAVGLWTALRKYQWMDVYFLIYIAGVLAFWNPKVGSVKARFLIPLVPFLAFYFVQGLHWVMEKTFRNQTRFGRRVEAGVVGVIVLALLVRNLQDWQNPVADQMTDLSIGTSWVAEHAPADSVVMVNEPVPAYVHARRQTIGFPTNGQDLERYLNNHGVEYIVIAPLLQSPRSTELDDFLVEKILPDLYGAPEKYRVVFSDSGQNVTVFQYLPGR